LGRIGEQEVRFVEEEHELRLVEVPHFGKPFIKFRQQPQEQRRIELGRREQLVGGKDVHHPVSGAVGLDEVVDVEHRLSDQALGALLLQRQQASLDGTDAGRRDVSVLHLEFLRVLPNILQQGTEVLEVEEQQSVVVGHLEGERQDAFLRVVERQYPAK